MRERRRRRNFAEKNTKVAAKLATLFRLTSAVAAAAAAETHSEQGEGRLGERFREGESS